MDGYVAVTHGDWFAHLAQRVFWDEVNFWRPSAYHRFLGKPGSPFFFKFHAPANAIGGFGLVASFSRLPDWLAWEFFGEGNGAASLEEPKARINQIKTKNKLIGTGSLSEIGCILLTGAVFFPRELWIPQPADWSPRNLTYQRYDLEKGEGLRIWRECWKRFEMLRAQVGTFPVSSVFESVLERAEGDRFGAPRLVRPRLGQGTFRVAVTDAYARACAVTNEQSLPVLEAAHIRPYTKEGPHELANGLLVRSDLHRLFDAGYITVTAEHRLEVSPRLRADYDNGRSYYPLHGSELKLPSAKKDWPGQAFLRWHNENVYQG